jgi:biopolymer transport protein TolQ
MPAPHIAQTGILELISEAGLVAKLVLLLLLGTSITCWAIIVTKWRSFKLASEQNDQFMKLFWNSKNIDEIVTKSEKFLHSPVAAVFKYGVKELRKFSNHASNNTNEIYVPSNTEKVDNIYRALIRASTTEITLLEKNLTWLATTASAAPFLGLFGTVWGIMSAFQSIGATGAANLAVVAPGISEALITTATGIGAAIPAVIAYNYFTGKVRKVAVDMECFSQDFINIIQRSLTTGRKGS